MNEKYRKDLSRLREQLQSRMEACLPLISKEPAHDWRQHELGVAFPEILPGGIRKYSIENSAGRKNVGMAHAFEDVESSCSGMAVQLGSDIISGEGSHSKFRLCLNSAELAEGELDEFGANCRMMDKEVRATVFDQEMKLCNAPSTSTLLVPLYQPQNFFR